MNVNYIKKKKKYLIISSGMTSLFTLWIISEYYNKKNINLLIEKKEKIKNQTIQWFSNITFDNKKEKLWYMKQNIFNITRKCVESLPSLNITYNIIKQLNSYEEYHAFYMPSLLSNTNILSILLSTACSKNCQDCSNEFIDLMGNLSSKHDQYAIMIAQNGTRYNKPYLYNLSQKHIIDPRLGNTLQKIVRKDQGYNLKNDKPVVVIFGIENITSLSHLIKSNDVPISFQEFAWWALGKSIKSLQMTNKDEKRLILKDNIAKNLLNMDILWYALENLVLNKTKIDTTGNINGNIKKHDESIYAQRQAANTMRQIIKLKKNGNIPLGATKVKIIIEWIKSNDKILQYHGLRLLTKIIKKYEDNDIIKQLIQDFDILDFLLIEIKKRHDNKDCTYIQLLKLLSYISEYNNNQEERKNSDAYVFNCTYPLDKKMLSTFSAPKDFTALSQEDIFADKLIKMNYVYDAGWIETLLENLVPDSHSKDYLTNTTVKMKKYTVKALNNMVKYGAYPTQVLQEWMISIIECILRDLPLNLRYSTSIQRLMSNRILPLEYERSMSFLRKKKVVNNKTAQKSFEKKEISDIINNSGQTENYKLDEKNQSVLDSYKISNGDKMIELKGLHVLGYLAGRLETYNGFISNGGLDFLRLVTSFMEENKHEVSGTEENDDGTRRNFKIEVKIKQEIAHIIANLLSSSNCQTVDRRILDEFSRPYWLCLLEKWTKSEDMILESSSVRALINLNFNKIQLHKNSKTLNYFFGDGINPIYPSYERYLKTFNKENEMNSFDLDIVFIHGIMGCAFGTWIITDNSDAVHSKHKVHDFVIDSKSIWPKTWLPNDLEKLNYKPRILSTSYEASLFESRAPWPALSLSERAKIMLDKLIDANLGGVNNPDNIRRPIIFVTHSMGGILLKEMMYQASKHKNIKHEDILNNTRSVIFYSVPHHGSPYAILGNYKLAKILLGPHPATKDLHGTPHLKDLNDTFSNFNHIKILSLGEHLPVRLPMISKIEAVVVPPFSSNPGYGKYYLLHDSDHKSICKPRSDLDLRYKLTKDFIVQSIMSADSKK